MMNIGRMQTPNIGRPQIFGLKIKEKKIGRIEMTKKKCFHFGVLGNYNIMFVFWYYVTIKSNIYASMVTTYFIVNHDLDHI